MSMHLLEAKQKAQMAAGELNSAYRVHDTTPEHRQARNLRKTIRDLKSATRAAEAALAELKDPDLEQWA